MTGRVFRINKLGGKPYRVSVGGCTLSLNFRTETAVRPASSSGAPAMSISTTRP